jgi:hypothetical protein
MAGLVPAIHVFAASERKTWMPGTRPGHDVERFLLSPMRYTGCAAAE